ncbi:MAG TPA: ABC transporter ATP-binding protein [Thermomicrobiales bacterium]|nr:ABC transporter ATP-binding protein [Thermomicrobiales bacterium]
MMMGGWGARGLALGGGGGPGGGRGNLTLSEQDFGRPFDARLMRRLLRYVAPYKLRIAVGFVLLLLYTGTVILNPLIPGLAIDDIRRGDLRGLGLMCLFYLANNTVMWLAQYQQVYQMTWVGQHGLYRLASDLFRHVTGLSLSFFDHNETGRIMARLQNDVTVLQQLLSNGLLAIFGSFLSLAGILFTLFVLNWRLAALVSLSVPLLLGVLLFWQRYARRSFLKARTAISAVNASLQENVSGVRVIQSLTRERTNEREFERVNAENRKVNLEAGQMAALVQPMVELISAGALAVALIVGGGMTLHGTLSLGFLVSFTLYINRFFDPIRDATQQYTNLQRATVAAERIFEILDTPEEVHDEPGAQTLPDARGAVEFRDVRFGYEPGVEVLHGVSFAVRPGEHVAVVGPTGAGKSTLVSLIARFYDVTGGAVLVDGHDVRDLTQASLRAQLGIVLQDSVIFTGTVYENILYGRPEATRAEVEAAARAVGAHELILRLPDGYDTPLRQNGANLSLGQRQLLSFARALLRRPAILLLDEATAGLDTHTERVLQDGIEALLRGRTAIIIAHRLSTVRDADRILVVQGGLIAEEGNHEELMARGGLYHDLYALGFQDVAAADAEADTVPGD